MNTVTEAAASSVALGWLPGIMTAVFLAFFAAWTWWAYRPSNARFFEEAGRMPLNDGALNDGEGA